MAATAGKAEPGKEMLALYGRQWTGNTPPYRTDRKQYSLYQRPTLLTLANVKLFTDGESVLFKRQRSYQVSKQVVGRLDQFSLKLTGRFGNHHQLEAANLQEDEQD